MSEAPAARNGRFGGIFVALVIAGSAVGVIGWYVATNRAGPVIDATGFDMDKAPQAQRVASSYSGIPAPQPASSLAMMRADAGIRVGDAASLQASAPAAAAKPADKKSEAHASFTEQARKHEGDVRNFAVRMTRRSPIIRQYGKDWMSHPDLRKLNDDYMRNHDPVAFIMGLTKAPSLGPMVKQYAGNPAIMSFITEGMKEAPADLTASALDVLSNDTVVKNLVANVAAGLGLPPSVTGLISGGSSSVDQNKMISDMLNSRAAQEAAAQSGAGAQPVPLQH